MQEEFLSVPWSASRCFEGDFLMHAELGWAVVSMTRRAVPLNPSVRQ
jgi:hypothetical protein